MIGLAVFSAALALTILWFTRKQGVMDKRWQKNLALISLPMPFLAASFGWIFTEMGRQPFVVAPNPTGSDQIMLMTLFGVSPSVSAGEVLTSMIVFTVVYAVLGVFWFRLIQRYAVEGAPAVDPEPDPDDDTAKPMSFAY
jgi:cytochrome d ubiquinol oxidase subunit I